MAIPKKLRQRNNENSAKYFAAGITALITVFIISHVSSLGVLRRQDVQVFDNS